MNATIKDVARVAGVSPSTVSRVISGSPRISGETISRVRKVMAELDYRPNLLARSLVNRSSKIIAAVLPYTPEQTFSEPFFFDVLRGVSSQAGKHGYNLLLSTGADPTQGDEAIEGFVSGGVAAGIILLTSRTEDTLQLDLENRRFPFVVLGHPTTPDGAKNAVRWVDNDNLAAGKGACEYLIARGCRKIAFAGYDARYRVAVDRLAGCHQALDNALIPWRKDWLIDTPYGQTDLDEDQLSIFTGNDRPDGVVAANDPLALSLIHKLDGMGVSVPEDVSIISFNNMPLGQFASPPLTTIDLDPFRLGLETCSLLIAALEGDSTQTSVTVPFQLVIRQSVK